MKKNNSLTFFILGLILAVLLSITFKKPVIRLLGGYTEIEKVVEVDTTYLPVTIDTTEIFNSYVKLKGIILNPEPIIKYIKIKEDKIEVIDSTKIFNVVLKDTLIDGNLRITNDFTGNLLDADFNYKPLFPKYITKIVPIKVTRRTREVISNDKLMFGAGVGMTTNSQFSVGAGIMDKHKVQYQLDYTKSNLINKDLPNVDIIGVKIFKFF